MNRFTDLPVDVHYSEHHALRLGSDCWCGEHNPAATVTWFNKETQLPDWADACDHCLHQLLGDVAQVAWDGSITVEAVPFEPAKVEQARRLGHSLTLRPGSSFGLYWDCADCGHSVTDMGGVVYGRVTVSTCDELKQVAA